MQLEFDFMVEIRKQEEINVDLSNLSVEGVREEGFFGMMVSASAMGGAAVYVHGKMDAIAEYIQPAFEYLESFYKMM